MIVNGKAGTRIPHYSDQRKFSSFVEGKLIKLTLAAERIFGSQNRDLIDIAVADTIHQFYIECTRDFEAMSEISSIDGWLRKVLISKAINYFRELEKRKIEDSDLESISTNINDMPDLPHEELDQGKLIIAKQVLDYIHTLTESQKQTFLLHYYCGLSCSGIAERLYTDYAIVKQNYYRLKEKVFNKFKITLPELRVKKAKQ